MATRLTHTTDFTVTTESEDKEAEKSSQVQEDS